MVKFVVANADMPVWEKKVDGAFFVFIRVGQDLFYCDTTIGKMWKVSLTDLIAGKDALGEGHRKIAQEMFSE